MKYLILSETGGAETPVFCLAPQTHAEMAAAWRRDPQRTRVVSAGFCEFTHEGVRTFGRSESLNMGPRPQDARIIAVFTSVTVRQGLRTETFAHASQFAAYPPV